MNSEYQFKKESRLYSLDQSNKYSPIDQSSQFESWQTSDQPSESEEIKFKFETQEIIDSLASHSNDSNDSNDSNASHSKYVASLTEQSMPQSGESVHKTTQVNSSEPPISPQSSSHSRVPKPQVSLLRSIQVDASGDLMNQSDLFTEALADLIQEQSLLLPSKIHSQKSRLNAQHQIQFVQDEEYISLYEYLQALSFEPSINHIQLNMVCSQILGFLQRLEKAQCPVIELNHEQLYFNTKQKSFQALCTTQSNYTWSELAANLLSHCLLLCGDMGGVEPASLDEHLEVSEVLLSLDLLAPKELRSIQRALSGQYRSLAEFISDFGANQNIKKDKTRILDVERIAVQRVGQLKYQKKANQFLSADLQQEDRFFDTCFRLNEQRYWCAAVFDGVSTCDYGTGADIAETCRGELHKICGQLKYSKELIKAIDEHQDQAVILDFITQHLLKAVKVKLDELMGDFELDAKNNPTVMTKKKHLAIPTSTMTIALLNEQGKVWFKWLGDSPALILNETQGVCSLLTSHSLKSQLVGAGELIETALANPKKNALVSDLSHLALANDQYSDDQAEHRLEIPVGHSEYTLQKGEVLLLCSDGLIDGFKSDAPPLGSDSYALTRIEGYLKENAQQSFYQQINKLCVRADSLNGVDNITVLALKPHWK